MTRKEQHRNLWRMGEVIVKMERNKVGDKKRKMK
jgi:hypothetical protein